MRRRTVTIYKDSRFLLSTNCGGDDLWADTRMDLRIRVDGNCDVHFAFHDPDALRLLAAAIHTLLANYRHANPVPAAPALSPQPYARPIPLDI